MKVYYQYFFLAFAFILCGCQSIFSQDMRLASAEPLFGHDLDRCLDDPEFMISLMAKPAADIVLRNKGHASATNPAADCNNLKKLFQTYLFADAAIPVLKGAPDTDPAEQRRNEIVQALIGMSNRKCGRYSAHIKTFDGQSNSILSVLAIATGGVGGLATSKDVARLMSGTSAVASGSRVAVNDAWFSNQTIQVLVAGYEKERATQLRAIQHKQMCPINYYPTMAGIADAMQYHASCSLITGLSAAAQAIERSDQPGIDVVRRQLTELAAIRQQAEMVVSGLPETSSAKTAAANDLLLQAEARYQALVADLKDATDSLTKPIVADDGTSALPDARQAVAINDKIKAITAQLETAKKDVETRSADLAKEKKTDSDNAAAKRQNTNIVESQAERLLCPLAPNAAK
jgi:hypothetical protein